MPQNPRLAVTLILIATMFIAGTTLLAKFVGTDAGGAPLHPLQISHGRFMFAFIFIGSAALIARPKLVRPNVPIHVGRTVFGWGGVTLMFAAAAYIPLADATAISFLNPVFGMIFAIAFLGERVGPWRWFAAGVALIGACVLMRPSADTMQLAALLALAAALLMGAELIFIKKLADREPPFQILLINNGLGVVIATLAVIPFWAMPTPAQWMGLVGIGGLMAMAQTCFINAMARADASFVTPFTYLTLVFAAFYDLVFFDVIPDGVSVLGAAIILAGAAILAWREGAIRNRQA